jgi:hypothetical protein
MSAIFVEFFFISLAARWQFTCRLPSIPRLQMALRSTPNGCADTFL